MYDFREVGVLLIFCAGIGGLCWAFFMIRKSMKIHRNTGISVGTVVSREVRSEDIHVTIQFLTAQNQEVRFKQQAPLIEKSKYRVLYDTTEPNVATLTPLRDIVYTVVMVALCGAMISETYGRVLPMLMG